jgi:hypothetical protein
MTPSLRVRPPLAPDQLFCVHNDEARSRRLHRIGRLTLASSAPLLLVTGPPRGAPPRGDGKPNGARRQAFLDAAPACDGGRGHAPTCRSGQREPGSTSQDDGQRLTSSHVRQPSTAGTLTLAPPSTPPTFPALYPSIRRFNAGDDAPSASGGSASAGFAVGTPAGHRVRASPSDRPQAGHTDR